MKETFDLKKVARYVKENSMYFNDYEVEGYFVDKTTEQAKEEYKEGEL